jgi:cytochrome c oxidase subunit 2
MAALFTDILILAAVILLIVGSLVAYSLLRFRARAGDREPSQKPGSRTWELVWTIIPVLAVAVIFIVTVRATARVDAPQQTSQPADLVITGHQWWWDARYSNGAVATGEIHIPAARRLLARIESADVIHDFWAPQLARKMDAVPGRPSFIWLEADRPGTYAGACSEFCGTQHAWMRFAVIAESEPSFAAWLERQSAPAREPSSDPEAQGARLFREKKCADCHSTSGAGANTTRGPDLSHLKSRGILGGGISANTPAALTLWLTNPQSAKPGNRMPATPLQPAEARALLQYLETLE